MNEGRPAGRPFESLTLISKDFTRAQRNSLAKIFFKTGDHEIGQAFVVTFDVSVVGEIGHDDQAKRFGERRLRSVRLRNVAARSSADFLAQARSHSLRTHAGMPVPKPSPPINLFFSPNCSIK